MKIYLIEYDCERYYVEAKDYSEAIVKWKDHVKKLWGDDYVGTEEPESCAKVHDEPIIR